MSWTGWWPVANSMLTSTTSWPSVIASTTHEGPAHKATPPRALRPVEGLIRPADQGCFGQVRGMSGLETGPSGAHGDRIALGAVLQHQGSGGKALHNPSPHLRASRLFAVDAIGTPARRQTSPARWPWLSLNRLKWSTSSSNRASGWPITWCPFSSAASSRLNSSRLPTPVRASRVASCSRSWVRRRSRSWGVACSSMLAAITNR